MGRKRNPYQHHDRGVQRVPLTGGSTLRKRCRETDGVDSFSQRALTRASLLPFVASPRRLPQPRPDTPAYSLPLQFVGGKRREAQGG